MKKILIVVDMQNDFIDGSLGTAEAVGILPNVINKIKNFDGEIYFTRDTHQTDYLSTREGRNLPVEHCVEGTQGWEIREEIRGLIKDPKYIFNKSTFGSKELIIKLIEITDIAGEENIAIQLVGLCTDICVISNALAIKTFLPEVKISADASCCAGVTPQSHTNALNAMRACQVEITGITEDTRSGS